ncbi:MAG: PAS domain S-box protein, partial [Bacteroidota bacterium]
MISKKEININYRHFLKSLPQPYFSEQIITHEESTVLTVAIIEANDKFEKLCGRSYKELKHSSLGDIFIELKEIEKKWIESYMNSNEKPVTFHHHYQFIKYAQSYYDMMVVVDEKGVISAIFNKSNYTGELKFIQNYYKRLFECTNEAAIIFDSSGKILNVNDKTCDLTQYDKLDLLGESINKLYFEEDTTKFKSFLKELFEYEQAIVELVLKKKNGNTVDVEYSANLLDKEQKIIQAIVRDISADQATRHKLKKSEEQFRLIANNISDVIWTMDLDLNTNFISPSIIKLTGYTPEEHVSQSLFDRFTPESAEFARRQFNEDLHRVIKGKLPPDYTFVGEMEYKHKNGGTVWAEIKVSSLRDDEGNFIGIQGVSRDISARRKAEKELEEYKNHLEELVVKRTNELKESENRFRSIVQHLSDIICIIDQNAIINYESPSTQKTLGYKQNYLIGKNAFDLVHPDDLNLAKKYFKEVLSKENTIREFGIRVKHADGRWIFLETIANNLLHHTGINGIILTARDITERIDAEKALRLSEEKFRNIFNYSNDGITIMDLKGNILEANKVSREWSKRSKNNILKSHISLFNNNIGEDQKKEYWEKLRKNGEIVLETEFEYKNKQRVELEVSSKLISYNGQEAILSTARDISERKNLEKKIVKAIFETEEKARDQFAKDLHDTLGAMLSSLKMYLNLLKKDHFESKEKKMEFWKRTMDLLSDSVSETRKIAYKMRPEEIDNFGLVSALDSFFERIMEASEIKVHFNKENFNTGLDGEKELILFRVISELVNNTLKHAEANNIDLAIFNKANKMYIVYSDDGIGFSSKHEVKTKGIGLNNIKSRLKSINAKYEMDSQLNNGM